MAFRPMRWSPTSRPSTNLTFPSPPKYKSTSSSSLTTLQKIDLMKALTKQPHQSFWDKVKHGGGDAISFVLDKLMRVNYGIAEGIREDKQGGHLHKPNADFFRGFKEGFLGHKKTTFADVLQEKGVLKGHGTLRAVAGFGLDVALDPTTYLTFGSGAVAKGAAKPAHAAALKFIDDAFVAATPEAAQKLLPHAEGAFHTLQTAGKNFEQRKALGVATLKALNKVARGEEITGADKFGLDLFRAGALEEMERTTPKALKVGVGNRGVTLSAGEHRVVPLPQQLNKGKTAAGRFLGRAFIPGFENPVMHRAMMVGRHGAERLTDEHMRFINSQFKGVEKLTPKEQLDALAAFEKEGGVLKNAAGDYELNADRFAGLSPAQAAFVTSWHNSVEYLRKRDAEFGVKYAKGPVGEKGQLYVPHVVSKDDVTFGGQRVESKLNSIPGFARARRGKSTVAELQALHEAGNLPKDLITDPFELLARRARASANKQADTALEQMIAKTMGLPVRHVNAADASAAERGLKEAQDAFDKIKPATQAELDAHAAELKAARVAEIQAQHDAIEKQLKTAYNKVKFGKKTQTKKATLARMQQRLDKLPARRQAALDAVEAGEDAGFKKKFAERIHANEAVVKEHRQAKKAVEVAQKAVTKAQLGKRNPGIKEAKQAGWVRPKGFDHYFPPKTAQAVERAVRIYRGDDEAIEGLTRSYRKYLSVWKLAVTSVNPGYRARNTLSDFWNMYVAGVPTWAMVKYGKRAAGMIRHAKTGADKLAKGQTLSKAEQEAVDEMLHAYNHGVLSGLFGGDVQQVRRYLEHHGSKAGLLKEGKLPQLVEKVAQDMNRNAENWGRLTHYLYRRQSQKMSVGKSAREVRAAHFDYEDLTPFERDRMKLIAPFYTWTRKNIPFQLRAIATRPGKFAAFPKFATEMEKAAGGGEGDHIPDYLRDNMAFKTPLGYLIPQIGAADLAGLSGKRAAKAHFLPMVSPAFKVPIELISNQRFGTDIPIKGTYDRNPVSNAAAKVLGAIPGNPANVGPTSRGGKKGPGASPWMGYVAGQVPVLNYLVNTKASIKQQQRKVPYGADIAYLAGLNFTEVDQDLQKLYEQTAFRDERIALHKNLRAEGLIPPPKKRKVSETEQLINSILAKNEGRR